MYQCSDLRFQASFLIFLKMHWLYVAEASNGRGEEGEGRVRSSEGAFLNAEIVRVLI